MSWCTIESDPGVFNALINEIGVKNVQVEEIYSLDSSEQRKEKSHGLIFLFKYRAESDPRPVLDSTETPVYFARQVVSNACATQAVISVLLNSESIDLGPTLSDFKAFTIDFDSESRGLAIGNSEVLREVHNSFARPEPFIHEEARNASDAEEAYHFVAYVPCHGSVYELDGLKEGPIYLGDIGSEDDWWGVAKPAIEERMSRYSATETHFALLTIGEKRSAVLENELNAITSRLATIEVALSSGQDQDSLVAQRETALAEMENIRSELADEALKLKRQSEENVRRKHNYVPLAMALLKHLAKRGKLNDMVASAEQRRANGNGDGRSKK